MAAEPPGTFEICPVCFFQDEPQEYQSLRRSSQSSLLVAQRTFATHSVSVRELAHSVRPPRPDESRPTDWQTLDDSRQEDLDGLLRRIEDAFKGVSLGDGCSLHQAAALDCYQENPRRGHNEVVDDWRKIPECELIPFQEFLFLDAEGLRYYLPAFMMPMLRMFESDHFQHQDSLVYCLDHPQENERFHILTQPQRETIVGFLQFIETYAMGPIAVAEALHALRHWT